jgi:hypothetical protein
MLDDLKYALRVARKSPAITLAAVLTIALGVGANTAVFSILNAQFLRPPPARDAGRLAWVVGFRNRDSRNLSFPEYRAYRDSATGFSSLAAFKTSRSPWGAPSLPVSAPWSSPATTSTCSDCPWRPDAASGRMRTLFQEGTP